MMRSATAGRMCSATVVGCRSRVPGRRWWPSMRPRSSRRRWGWVRSRGSGTSGMRWSWRYRLPRLWRRVDGRGGGGVAGAAGGRADHRPRPHRGGGGVRGPPRRPGRRPGRPARWTGWWSRRSAGSCPRTAEARRAGPRRRGGASTSTTPSLASPAPAWSPGAGPGRRPRPRRRDPEPRRTSSSTSVLTESSDVRRSLAAGELARRQLTLDLATTPPTPMQDAAPGADAAPAAAGAEDGAPPAPLRPRRSPVPIRWGGSRTPGPRHRRTGPGLVRPPRHPAGRETRDRPGRPRPRRRLRGPRPDPGTPRAARPPLRLPVVHPPRPQPAPGPGRLRRRPHHALATRGHRRPDLYLPAGAPVSQPPPPQDPHRLDDHRRSNPATTTGPAPTASGSAATTPAPPPRPPSPHDEIDPAPHPAHPPAGPPALPRARRPHTRPCSRPSLAGDPGRRSRWLSSAGGRLTAQHQSRGPHGRHPGRRSRARGLRQPAPDAPAGGGDVRPRGRHLVDERVDLRGHRRTWTRRPAACSPPSRSRRWSRRRSS